MATSPIVALGVHFVEQRHGAAHVFRGVGLGEDQRVRARSQRRARVGLEELRADGVHAHHALTMAEVERAQRLDGVVARFRLAAQRYAVLEFDDDRVGRRLRRFGQLACIGGRGEEQRFAREGRGHVKIVPCRAHAAIAPHSRKPALAAHSCRA